jgi:hypothetical protein
MKLFEGKKHAQQIDISKQLQIAVWGVLCFPFFFFWGAPQGEEPAPQCLYKNAFIKKNENSWKMTKK